MIVDFYSTQNMPRALKRDFMKSVRQTIDSDVLIEGTSCRAFEYKFADYLGVSNALGVGNGFDALKVSLQALELGPGDRIAVPAHTFIATWYAVLSIGAKPVGVDVTPDGQIDLDHLEKIENLQAVIPVHMHGTHCDMKRLTNWAKGQGVKIIEDCAQSAGLEIQGKKAGSWGDIAAFSFYPTKNLFAMGDGGAIATNDKNLHEKARMLSRYGADKNNKYKHLTPGQNSRLDSIQANFLVRTLDYLDGWNYQRLEVAHHYLEFFSELALPVSNNSIYHHFAILIEDRDRIKKQLFTSGVNTEIHYPFVAGLEVQKLPNKYPSSVSIANHTLSLPISPWQTSKQTSHVIKTLTEILK